MTRRQIADLQKEQRLLGYRILAGTITRENRERLAEIKAQLGEVVVVPKTKRRRR